MKYEVKKVIYACDSCRFLFKRVGEVEQCPDCGKYNVRAANEEEIAEFLSRRPEDKLAATKVNDDE